MRIVIHPYARKRGLSDAQIVAAYETGSDGRIIRWRDKAADPRRWAIIGFDQQARQIELIVVEGLGETNIIIHANFLTKGFSKEIERSRR